MILPAWSDITYINDAGIEKVNFKKLRNVIKTSALNVSYAEVCTPAVIHFNLFHDATSPDRFVSFFFGTTEQKFQLNYPKKNVTPQMLTVLVELSKKFRMNL